MRRVLVIAICLVAISVGLVSAQPKPSAQRESLPTSPGTSITTTDTTTKVAGKTSDQSKLLEKNNLLLEGILKKLDSQIMPPDVTSQPKPRFDPLRSPISRHMQMMPPGGDSQSEKLRNRIEALENVIKKQQAYIKALENEVEKCKQERPTDGK